MDKYYIREEAFEKIFFTSKVAKIFIVRIKEKQENFWNSTFAKNSL